MAFARSIIKNQIIASMRHCLPEFEKKILELAANEIYSAEDEYSVAFQAIQKKYLESVFDDVIFNLRSKNPTFQLRFAQFSLNPKVCGYDFDINDMLYGGKQYAACYYLYTGEIADAKTCIKMNHICAQIIDYELAKIQKNYLKGEMDVSSKDSLNTNGPQNREHHKFKRTIPSIIIGSLCIVIAFLLYNTKKMQIQLDNLKNSSEYNELVTNNNYYEEIEEFVKDGLCGFASEAFYADQPILIMEVGDEKKIHMFSTPELPSNDFEYQIANNLIGVHDAERLFTDIYTNITYWNTTVVAKEAGISEITFNLGHNTMRILVIVK